MFEQQIEIQKARLADIISLGASPFHGGVQGTFLTSSPLISDAYRQYFSAEIAKREYELRIEMSENSCFRFANADESLSNQFSEMLHNSAFFSAQEISELAENAVKLRLNYLCRPRITLRHFIFREKITLSIHEIYVRLNYFYDYSYLIENIRQQINSSGRAKSEYIAVDEFMKIVEDNDNEYILELTPRQFAEILTPLFEFFSPDTTLDDEKSIPTEALIIFLDDKHVEPIAQECERLYFEDNCAEINESIFLEIVTRILEAIDKNTVQDILEEKYQFVRQNVEKSDKINVAEDEDNGIAEHSLTETSASEKYKTKCDFLITPDEFASTIAFKEFIHPEFVSQKNQEMFKPKFAIEVNVTESNAEKIEEASLDEALAEIAETLNETDQSLSELKKAFEDIESLPITTLEMLEHDIELIDVAEQEMQSNSSESTLESQAAFNSNEGIGCIIESTQNEIQETKCDSEDSAFEGDVLSELLSDTRISIENCTEGILNNADNIDDEILSALEAADINSTVQLDEINDIKKYKNDNICQDIDLATESIEESNQLIAGISIDVSNNSDNKESLENDIDGYEHHSNADILSSPSRECNAVSKENNDDKINTANEINSFNISDESIIEKEAISDVIHFNVVINDTAGQHEKSIENTIINSDAEHNSAENYPLLTNIIGNKRDRFIKKLCEKDQSVYQELISKIESCSSWKEAAQIYDYFLLSHSVPYDNAAAVEFRDIIKLRYSA